MSEICYGHIPSTFSQVLIASILATQLANSHAALSNEPQGVHRSLLQQSYSSGLNKATFDLHRNPFSGMYSFTADKFEVTIGNFYARLFASQEPLGGEFERVLHDNLWNLYES